MLKYFRSVTPSIIIIFLLLHVGYLTWFSDPKTTVVLRAPPRDEPFPTRIPECISSGQKQQQPEQPSKDDAPPSPSKSLITAITSSGHVDQPQSRVILLDYKDNSPSRTDPFIYNSYSEIGESFYRYFLWYNDAFCPHMIRVGGLTDGGWDMCITPPYVPTHGACMVLSFGISNNYEFDDDINSRFKCTVHSFDPSMKTKSYQRKDNMWFHDLGLADVNGTTVEGWKMLSLKQILQQLHLSTTVIDVLKFDIEGSEWEALEAMFKDGSLSNVKQLMFEIHIFELLGTFRHWDKDASVESIRGMVNTLNHLTTIGFRRYYVHANAICVTKDKPWCTHASCLEAYYINTKFLT